MILSNHGFVLGHLEIVSVSETVIVLKSLWTSGRRPGDSPEGDVFSILLALVCDLCLLFFSVGGLLAFINTPLPSLLRTAPIIHPSSLHLPLTAATSIFLQPRSNYNLTSPGLRRPLILETILSFICF